LILLDTSLLLTLGYREPLAASARDAINAAGQRQELWVSAISAWELGLLATRTGRTGPQLGDARDFLDRLVGTMRLQMIPLTHSVAFDAAYLPEPFHRDPSDRMLIATARAHDFTLATKDRAILAYAALGHVRAIRA
jgi:PIN domain nuclease of toxin-antitoxin system